MESNIIFVLILTFILSSIFKSAFWLKIPIGCFLLVLGSLAHGIYQTTGLIVFVAVFALPYLIEKQMAFSIGGKVKRRLNKPVIMDFLDLKKRVYRPEDDVEDISSTNIDYDLKMIVELDRVGVEDADYILNFWGKFRVVRGIYWQAYKTRGFFISYILIGSIFILGMLSHEFSIPFMELISSNKERPEPVTLIGFWVLLTTIESLFYISPKEVSNKINQFLEDFKRDSMDSTLEIAKEKQKKLIANQTEEQRENRNKQLVIDKERREKQLEIEQERTKQKEMDTELKKHRMDLERPEKERKLSAILDRLDDL